MAHSIIASELATKKINSQLVLLAKERLIRYMNSPILQGKIDKEYGYNFDECTYYDDNYEINTEETICNFVAFEVIEQLFQQILTNEDMEKVQNMYQDLQQKINIKERYFESNL